MNIRVFQYAMTSNT